MKRLLLLSNSTNFGEPFLHYPLRIIRDFLGSGIHKALFVPYAAVRTSYDDYAARVSERFGEIGCSVASIHEAGNPVFALEEAEAVVIGGGNTFQLLTQLYAHELVAPLTDRVLKGLPYIGWSAGANVACPTIRTTNDMPIVQPPSLQALSLIPFQINPHYTDSILPNHQGETRAERLLEFVHLNPGVRVLGLREGSVLKIEGSSMQLLGDKSVRIFEKNATPQEYPPHASLNFLLG